MVVQLYTINEIVTVMITRNKPNTGLESERKLGKKAEQPSCIFTSRMSRIGH